MTAIRYITADLSIKTVDQLQRVISGFAAYHSNRDRVQDIIDPSASVKAVARLADNPKRVGVFIGHKTDSLPMGVPLVIEARQEGLYTETLIKPGPSGDDLLATAAFLQQHGSALGMSIGYRTRDSKMERGAAGMTRRILDYELAEYSYAANQAIANESALVVGVKARKAAEFEIEEQDDGFHIRDLADGDDLGTFDTREAAQTAIDALMQEENEPDDEDDGKAVKVAWTGAYMHDLPDSAFLFITPGGAKDDEGKTVPRSNRHFPYRDAEGKVDLPHLRDAIGRIPQADVLNKDALQARAQRLLAEAQDGKTYDWGAAWDDGAAALDVRAIAYALTDLSEKIAETQAHLAALGQDVKAGRVLSSTNLDQLHGAMQKLQQVHGGACEKAGDCPLMSNGAKVVASYRRRLELLAV